MVRLEQRDGVWYTIHIHSFGGRGWRRRKGAQAMDLWEKTISSQTLFEGKIVTLKVDHAQLPNGALAGRGGDPAAV